MNNDVPCFMNKSNPLYSFHIICKKPFWLFAVIWINIHIKKWKAVYKY